MAISLSDLRTGSRVLCDFPGDDAISDTQFNTWINEGARELHLLVSTAEDTFFSTVDFTISSGNTYSIPTNFMRIKGLDIDPDTSSARNVSRYNFGERNSKSSDGNRQDRFYRVMGRTLYIEPSDNALGDYRLYYVPAPTTLTASVDLDVALEPYHEYIMVVTAIKALIFDKLDPSLLLERRNTMRQDISDSVQVDESEPCTVTDTSRKGPAWPWNR